jgi:hypothetical protein
MRCSATVVLPEPAPPWITTRPVPGSVIRSNCARSMSAAISGSCLFASWAERAGSMRRRPRGGVGEGRGGRAAVPWPPESSAISSPPSSNQSPSPELTKVPWGAPMRRSLPAAMLTLRRACTTPRSAPPGTSSS